MTALAVRDSLLEACAIEADIKWPNDLLVSERKICGILAETIETEQGRACIVGIGINLDDRAFPPELQATATAVASVTREPPDAEKLLQALIRAIARRYEALLAPGGQAETVHAWSSASSYAEGLPVRIRLEDETIEGLTRGLEPDGALRVETDQGKIRIVRAGDVTSLRVTEDRKVISDK
jgi:BirA family biotin operon repressor/biotin-[acetyl-CoA-carboxylase] ligase